MQYQFWAPEQRAVPHGARDSGCGWQETHGTATWAAAGRLLVAADMEIQGPRCWGGEIQRDRTHAVGRMTNQKGHDKLGNIYFLAFEYVLHPVESQINSLIKSSCRVRWSGTARPQRGGTQPRHGRGDGEQGETQPGTQRGIVSESKGSLHTAFSPFATQLHSVSQIYGSCDVWSSFHLSPACSQSHGEIVP